MVNNILKTKTSNVKVIKIAKCNNLLTYVIPY